MRLQGKRVAIIIAEGVEELEYHVPTMRLLEEGAEVYTAALEMRSLKGKNGLCIHPDTLVDALDASDLDGLILPGGWAPDKLRRYPVVISLVHRMNEAGKTIGIICHGGLIAISAGIVKGKRATGSLGIKDDLVNAGAIWVDEPAFRDGNQVWGRVVADLPDFNRHFVSALAGD